MSTIRILPEKVASQIAAGEVIERPASVLRELLDNSLDAGANRIVIAIEKGGKGLVKVSDNGRAMSRDDLLLCIERHATSKIGTASDLFSVKTLGFRGEAIPSMAAVSRMQITSRPEDQLVAYRLKVAGGKVAGVEETGAPAGTTVEVRDLFFNIPARRKFLRASRTETDHMLDVLVRSALPFPGKAFRLDEGKKTLLNLPASGDLIPRFGILFGRQVAGVMIEAEKAGEDLKIRVYLAPPDYTRSRGDRLFVYVNGRNVRDRLLTKAVIQGYGQRLMKGQYPQAVVFLEVDPAKVDVNVHPTKQEVRFHLSRLVFDTTASTVQKALAGSIHGLAGYDIPQGQSWPVRDRVPVHGAAEPTWTYQEGSRGISFPRGEETAQEPVHWRGPRVIGQLGNTYILCQVEDGLAIIDQHAAHERVVYETLKKGLKTAGIESQRLLVPYSLELSTKETGIITEKGERLSRLGIEIEPFGGNAFLLRSFPALLKHVRWEQFFPELALELEEEKHDEEDILDRALTVMACHGAIRAGQVLTQQEMTHLLEQLEEMDLPTNCPHGRPVFKRLTYYEMEKMFKRVL